MKRTFFLSALFAVTVFGATARQPERGYRGFVDWTNRIYHGSSLNGSRTFYSPGISTSHGYQFNPWLFAGAGIDYSLDDTGYWEKRHNYSIDNYFLSVFGHVRTDLQLGRFTPFADLRLGWNADSNGTVYFSPSIGYRFNWGRKTGINVGLGYTLDSYRYQNYIQIQAPASGYPQGLTIFVPTGEFNNWNRSSFTFRIGIDF